MKTLDTIAGKTYVVTSSNGCTVTDETGLTLGTVEAGQQKVFVATGAKLQADDDSARITATFNSAPAKLMALGLLGGGIKVDPLMKYAECVTVADMVAVNPDYKNDLTPDGEWLYPLPKLNNAIVLFKNASSLKKIGIDFPAVDNGAELFNGCGNLEFFNVRKFPKLTNASYFLRSPKIKTLKCEFTVAKELFASFMLCSVLEASEITAPELVNAGALHSFDGKLRHFRCTLGKLSNGGSMLNGCILDKDSALHVLNDIPAWSDGGTHNLTIGIHIDHQTDEEVVAAIADAEAKGWTVTVQWNGTATVQAVSTFSLRRKPVYAKVGNMVLPDGTAEQYLDWGHYVTNAEANGYMEFSSVAEAREYFGLPAEQEELLINSTAND